MRRAARNTAWAVGMAALLGVGAYGLSGALEGLDLGDITGHAAPSTSKPSATPSPSTSTAAPTPRATGQAVTRDRFDPATSDAANLGVFKRSLESVAGSTPSSSVEAKSLTAALSAARFDASSMQHSADRTSADLQAPTITVAVRLKGSCLVGQYVRSDASVSAEVAAPVKATGACLIGRQPG